MKEMFLDLPPGRGVASRLLRPGVGGGVVCKEQVSVRLAQNVGPAGRYELHSWTEQ